MVFEILDGTLVLFSARPRRERTQVPTFTRLGILLARIETIATANELANHGASPSKNLTDERVNRIRYSSNWQQGAMALP